MSRTGRLAVVLAVVVALAGCGGVTAPEESPSDGEQRLRFVVGNDAATERTVTLTFTSAAGRTVHAETKTLQPDGGWIVSTFDVASLDTPVTVTARFPGRNETVELTPIRGADRGSRLHRITDDGIDIHECNRNVTCWRQQQEAL